MRSSQSPSKTLGKSLRVFYILDDNKHIQKTGADEYLEWFHRDGGVHRIIRETKVGSIVVSTVFVGMNGYIFETLVSDGSEYHYRTYRQAVSGHDRIVREYMEKNDG